MFLVSIVSSQTKNSAEISIEIDPAPYILKGYSVSLKYNSKKYPKLAFMVSVYQSNFPDGMMSQANKDNGWTNMKLETSYAAFVEYHLTNKRNRFHIGPSLFYYNKSVELENTRVDFSTIFPNARIGYIWYPFKKMNLYLNPWCNFGSEINLDEKNQLNGIHFQPNKFNYIVALHIGYSFPL